MSLNPYNFIRNLDDDRKPSEYIAQTLIVSFFMFVVYGIINLGFDSISSTLLVMSSLLLYAANYAVDQ